MPSSVCRKYDEVELAHGATAPSRRLFLRIGDHQVGIEEHLRAKPVAHRAGAEGIVEREQARLDLRNGEAGDRAGELGRKRGLFAGIDVFGIDDAVGQRQRRFDGVRQPVAEVGLYHDAVHDHLQIVLQLLVKGRGLVDLVHLAVDLDALEAALAQFLQFLAVLALAAADHGRQDHQPRALRHRRDAVDHLAGSLAFDG